MQELYQHFHREEQPFVDQVLEWKAQVEMQYAPKLTSFLDPRQQDIISSIIGKNNEIHYLFFGGAEHTERKRGLIYPNYYEPTEDDFQIAAYSIEYPAKFVKIEHRDILGTLMSLGIKRDRFGDILMKDEAIQIIVAAEIRDYVSANMEKVANAPVKLNEISLREIFNIEETWEIRSITAASLRLDAIIAEAYQLSRQKATSFINQNLVKVNWKLVEQPSYLLQEGDYLSVRRYGRCKIMEISGKTKKDKWRIALGYLK